MANDAPRHGPSYEFHVARDARDRYQFDLSLFSVTGNVVLANFHAARVFAQKMNAKRDLLNYPEQAVKAGQINAMGLIDEMLHLVVAAYREQVNPNVMRDALQSLQQELGQEQIDAALRRFAQEFPPLAVYRRETSVDDYLQGETAGVSHREVVLEEMLMLWLGNVNPAFSPFLELFDDAGLEKQTVYPRIFPSLQAFFAGQPGFGAEGQNLLDLLRAPALTSPHSLAGQLDFLRNRWGFVLSKYLYRLLGSLDLITEEEKVVFPGGGPGPAQVYEFAGLETDPERFTADREWMPRLTLMAKNAYVWLDQLSKARGQRITRLDQIPDEELDALAQGGFTGLWLIGLWERSVASRRIKQLTGNPDAVASAYSLRDYRIADDLGGEEAYRNLRDRAWQRGIRLASDMVPNHMGIDSSWVIEHPEWFLALDYSPFPSYTFNGPDLSPDGRCGIYLEDHYYDRTDAAVVFKRVDREHGGDRYIYHGNDGTSMPWNDTAQLNYLLPEVREAVIQTILHVARQFPIIRFDAAMTLAKRHVQRLWFPEPGTGGAIASRAEHGMTKQQFDAWMPVEFWREVVDRAAVEAPDTLLLAEAFWMLEGYFVRTLGMHRVYNSAFMHMLRDEDNAKYRLLMKNTLEFDPEILKRYVNFMNNPDERTAVEQFGKGDKYFAICTLLATLPGLPMFGHGQVQGFAEKYGMEYRRAYWDERPDEHLVQRHEREIFPLLHRRYLFAGVEQFLLYDFFDTGGGVNEDVFAYSNRVGDERALVVVHNKYASARGWVRTSVAYSMKTGADDERTLVRRDLGQGLGLAGREGMFCIFQDQSSGLEYIRGSKDLAERGLYIELDAYRAHVFLQFREVQDDAAHPYGQLAAYLNGQGVPSIEAALRETFLQPVHYPFRELVDAGMFRRIMDASVTAAAADTPDAALLDEVEAKMLRLLQEAKRFAGGNGDEREIARQVRRELEALLPLPVDTPIPDGAIATGEREVARPLARLVTPEPELWGSVLGWLFTHALGKLIADEAYEEQSRSLIDEWLLAKIIAGALQDFGLDPAAASRTVRLIKVLVGHERCFEETAAEEKPAYHILEEWLQDEDVHQFIGVNRYGGVLWFNRESFDQLVRRTLLVAAVAIGAAPVTPVERTTALEACYESTKLLEQAAEESEYKVDNLVAAAKGSIPSVAP
jgi:glycosidase